MTESEIRTKINQLLKQLERQLQRNLTEDEKLQIVTETKQKLQLLQQNFFQLQFDVLNDDERQNLADYSFILKGMSRLDDKLESRLINVISDSIAKDKELNQTKAEVHSIIQRYKGNAFTLTATGTGAINRIKRITDAINAGFEFFQFSGPEPERRFCKLHYGQTYHITDIIKLDNQQNLDVLSFCGGYNCTHDWEPVPAPDEKKITPKPKTRKVNRSSVTKKVETTKSVQDELIDVVPAGQKKISDHFTVQSRQIKDQFDFAIAQLDKIISDGQLQNIPFKLDNRMNAAGMFRHTPRQSGNIAVDIKLNLKKNDHPELTLLHEIGHYLDVTALTKTGYASKLQTDQNMKALMKALNDSPEILEMKQKKGEYFAKFLTNISMRNQIQGYYKYLMSEQEMFARAFAQYIAVKSDSKLLKEQVNKLNERDLKGIAKTQWNDQNFVPILEQFDNLFQGLQWQKKK